MPSVMQRIENVKRFRLASKSQPTRDIATSPTRFHVENIPRRRFLVIPKVSSERRQYIPMGIMEPSAMASDLLFVLPEATSFHFGVLTSEMHMAWVRQVCGRLKSDFRYSNKLVYNNFPWPQNVSDKQKAAVESAARAVLDVRASFKGQTLADLYDPLAMPKALRDAHADLDRAVDKCYRAAPFTSERARVEYLFELYQRLVTPLTAPGKGRKRKA